MKKIKTSQQCTVICDECKIEFKRCYNTIITQREKYSSADLCYSCLSKLLRKLGVIKTFSQYNKDQIGKTSEERLGKEKADIMKRKMSINNKGENNPNFENKSNGANGFIRHNKEIKGKTYEEIFGEEKAKEIKLKISISGLGEKNHMFGIAPSYKSGSGWSGHYQTIHFRSVLELHYLIYLINNNINFENGELKKHHIRYKMNGINKNYLPDFYLPDTDETIELKPKKLVGTYQNKLKFEAAKEKLGDKHIILTEDNIVKIELETLYNKYILKELVFDEKYIEKFENYYNKNRKKE